MECRLTYLNLRYAYYVRSTYVLVGLNLQGCPYHFLGHLQFNEHKRAVLDWSHLIKKINNET